MMALEIYSAIGTSAGTITASYTNEAGTSGQASPATSFGVSGFQQAQRFIPLPLAAGDVGVRAVASVAMSATSGTAGNFGVTLFKPLGAIFVPTASRQVDTDLLSGYQFTSLEPILTGASLFLVALPAATTAATTIRGVINLAEV